VIRAIADLNLLDDLAADLCDFALEITHPGFARVSANDLAQAILRDRQLLFLQAIVLHLLGQQIFLGNGKLLVFRVARQTNHFHAVEQSRWHIERVRRGDEHHAREIEIDLEIVILESMVLFRIQYLEQRRGGIATEVH